MIEVRASEDRGTTQLGWLDGRHTFAFGGYADPTFRGFRSLRVLNEDRVQPGFGFGMHPHRDMEIVTYVLSGELSHEDDTGTSSVLAAGDVQAMSAGTGIVHGEFNRSADAAVHLFQIWIEPDRSGAAPRYAEKSFRDALAAGGLTLLASRDARDGSLEIHQDADIYGASMRTGDEMEHSLLRGEHAWVQVVSGSVTVASVDLGEGDGAAISAESKVIVRSRADSQILLFDLA